MVISVNEVYNMIEKNRNIFIVDMRNESDYKVDHFKNAINIIKDKIVWEIENYIANKSKFIIIYSYSYNECEEVYETLCNNGYSNVFIMDDFKGK